MRRDQIFTRDDFRCAYCGEHFAVDALTVDHVQPKMRGGDRSGGNLVTACAPCNARKGGRALAAFLHDDAVAREQFLRRAAPHVWPRIMRALEDDLKKHEWREIHERRER